jgi:hypothetical protein
MSTSTWGDTWGAFWGDTWGAIDTAGVGGIRRRTPVVPERFNDDEDVLLLIVAALSAMRLP